MEKQEFIEKNKGYIKRTRGRCRMILLTGIVPRFINSVMCAKKIAKLMGYNSITKFMKLESYEIDRLYNNLDPETREKVDALYDKLEPEMDKVTEMCDDVKHDWESTDIPINVMEQLDPEWDADDDSDISDKFEEIKQSLIDKLFDGVDPVDDDV